MGYAQTFILGLVIYQTILLGVEVNAMHEKHKSDLLYIKSSFNYILLNWKIFLDMTTYVNPYLHKAKEMYFLYKEYHKKTPKEKIEMDEIEGTHIPYDDEDFKENLKNLCEKIDWTVEQVELEEVRNPVRMLGIKIDSNFLKDFYIAAITIFYSLFQYIINEYVLKG